MTITPPAQIDAAVLAKSPRATFDGGRTRVVQRSGCAVDPYLSHER